MKDFWKVLLAGWIITLSMFLAVIGWTYVEKLCRHILQ